MAAHASVWPPSSAARRLTCPGSYWAELGKPDTASAAAMEGSAAHELAAEALQSRVSCLSLVGKVYPEYKAYPVTSVMAGYVQQYVTAMRRKARRSSIPVMVETRVSLHPYARHQFGTADCITLDGKVLHVDDLKYGTGVKVGAVNNEQALCYALGAYSLLRDKYKIEAVRVGIHQPRLNWFPHWECSLGELMEFGEEVREGFLNLFAFDPERVPSRKGCTFCKARATCPEHREWLDRGGTISNSPQYKQRSTEELLADFM